LIASQGHTTRNFPSSSSQAKQKYTGCAMLFPMGVRFDLGLFPQIFFRLNDVQAATRFPDSFLLRAQQSLPDRAGLGGSAPSELTNQWLWANSRIAGTAVLADTNNIEINAVPLSP
jgi:hypothetical protein